MAWMATAFAHSMLQSTENCLMLAMLATAVSGAWLLMLPVSYSKACHALRLRKIGCDMDTILQTWVEPVGVN